MRTQIYNISFEFANSMMPAADGARTLSEVLGGSKELAVFEAFALRNDRSLSVKDASLIADVAWATAHRMVNDWTMRGVLDQVGKTGKANLYHLNLDSPTVRALSRAVNTAVRELLEADLMTEGVEERLLLPAIQASQTERSHLIGKLSVSNTRNEPIFGWSETTKVTNRNTGMTEVPA
jgi:hypothetical protein